MRIPEFRSLLPLGLVLFAFLSLVSCKDNKTETPAFDRQALNEATAEKIIIPSYTEFRDALLQLETDVNSFLATPTQASLETVRTQLKSVRLQWQYCSFYNFGPALDVSLLSFVNIFPVDLAAIESNIENGGYDLSNINTRDAQGLQSLGYLLHGNGSTDAEIIAAFNSGDFATERKNYVGAILSQMKSVTTTVVNEWQTYATTYSSQEKSGTDAGSSLSLLLNEWNKYFEVNLRDGKIGIPNGERSLGVQQPDKVEAYYGKYSVALAIASIEAYQALYLGEAEGETVLSLDDYVSSLSATTVIDGSDLSKSIRTQLEAIIGKLEALNDPLSEEVMLEQAKVKEVFLAMQQLIIYIKSDMTAAMGISINYIDNDGD